MNFPPERRHEVDVLWQTVRLGALSSSRQMEAAEVDAIPKKALVWASAQFRRGQPAVSRSFAEASRRELSSLPRPDPIRRSHIYTCIHGYSLTSNHITCACISI